MICCVLLFLYVCVLLLVFFWLVCFCCCHGIVCVSFVCVLVLLCVRSVVHNSSKLCEQKSINKSTRQKVICIYTQTCVYMSVLCVCDCFLLFVCYCLCVCCFLVLCFFALFAFLFVVLFPRCLFVCFVVLCVRPTIRNSANNNTRQPNETHEQNST